MILFITMRAHTLDIARRLRQFANLGEEVRHVVLAEGEFAEFRGRAGIAQWTGRLAGMVRGVFQARRALKGLTGRDILYVHALDALAVTRIARALTNNHSRLACQLLDVHHYLLAPGPRGALLRALERRLLRGIDLLVVPTAGNIPGHYRPVARYSGPFAVVHNTLPTGERPSVPPPLAFDGVWTIGWFGSLRCERALALLCEAARRMGPKLRILAAGVLKFPPGLFERSIAGLANIAYLGPFDAPAEAAALYARAHVSYAIHFEPPVKAEWALPVRILEGGAYGRPALARSDADCGAFVRDNGIGWTVGNTADDLVALLSRLEESEYRRVETQVRAREDLFIGESQLAAALAILR
jgi:succinoglycan biosynthesis protein ExoL